MNKKKITIPLFSVMAAGVLLAVSPTMAVGADAPDAAKAEKLIKEKGLTLDNATFMKYALVDDVETVKLFLEAAKAGKVKLTTEDALLEGCDSHAVKVVKLLVKSGVNVNCVNEASVSPLMIAAANGQGDMVAVLLAAGADKNAVNDSGDTAICYAAAEGHAKVIKQLAEAGADVNKGEPIFDAIEFDQIDAIKALITSGGDVNRPHPEIRSKPLAYARAEGKKEIAELLAAAGAK